VIPEWVDPSPWLEWTQKADRAAVARAIGASDPGIKEFATLLSPAAGEALEAMAERAQALTRRHFGRTITLFAPLYLSNYCSSGCVYCGFAASRHIPRHRLNAEEQEAELAALHEMGVEEILLLTGERTTAEGYEYIRDAVKRAAAHYHDVCVEVFPMSEGEYRGLREAGTTGIIMFQETYDPVRYDHLHTRGPKRDYLARLEAPARALAGGMRVAGLGALLGLSDPMFDMLAMYRHAAYLRQHYWRGGVTLSFPRVRPEVGGYAAEFPVDERQLAQIVFAFRIAFPDVPLTLSTRESPRFRDGIAGVGVSKMSVASRTTVGGYGERAATDAGQFDVNDSRDRDAFCGMLRAKGLQPVFKNWDGVYRQGSGAGG
jgi:2-iminoacetate synthase